LAEQELYSFITDIKKTQTLTGKEMEEFAKLLSEGKGASGAVNNEIKAFNDAIKATVKPGVKVPTKYDDIVEAGKKYMKNGRFRSLVMGGVLAGLLTEAVATQVKVLEVTAKSGHYKRAIEALEDGNIAYARSLLVSTNDSLYMEINAKVNATAAGNFRMLADKLFDDVANRKFD
jgi:hypothetical protein